MRESSVSFAVALCLLLAAGPAGAFCERTEYQQYKDRITSDAVSVQRSYCATAQLRDMAGKAGDMRQMQACHAEITKMSDAMAAAGLGAAPDCIGLDPQRAAAAFCKEGDFCTAFAVTRGRVKAPSTEEALHCTTIVVGVLKSTNQVPKCP